jgi:hypothetical protein
MKCMANATSILYLGKMQDHMIIIIIQLFKHKNSKKNKGTTVL